MYIISRKTYRWIFRFVLKNERTLSSRETGEGVSFVVDVEGEELLFCGILALSSRETGVSCGGDVVSEELLFCGISDLPRWWCPREGVWDLLKLLVLSLFLPVVDVSWSLVADLQNLDRWPILPHLIASLSKLIIIYADFNRSKFATYMAQPSWKLHHNCVQLHFCTWPPNVQNMFFPVWKFPG